MDVCSGKRGVGSITAPRKGYNVASKNAATEREQNAQFCNRIGCSGRIKYSQNTKVGSSDKAKCSKPSCHPSHGNEITANSSRSSSIMTSSKKLQLDSKRKLSSQLKFDPTESNLSTESELMSSSSSSPTGYQSKSRKNSGMITVTEIGSSSSVSSNVRPRKPFHQKSDPAFSVPSVSKSPALRPFSGSNGSPSCSSPESKSLGKNVMKKRSPEGESSLSSRGRKSTYGISITESGQSSSASGDSNSTWNRRSTNVNTRMRLSSPQNGRNCSSVREPSNSLSRNPNDERPFNIGGRSSSRQFSGNVSLSDSRSYSFSSSNDDNPSARMPFTSSEPSFSFGIAEVLLALERLEQDEELTHEQVITLETSLFLSGLNLYDQHRDMRLDIDNMSYEVSFFFFILFVLIDGALLLIGFDLNLPDLLALEERMGTVSTAVSEEAMSKCVRRGVYQSTPSEERITGSAEDGDDIKCSICQEEYVTGDEIGKLAECQHGYHETCINQWLRVKNWCPICKASAAPSQSRSSS
ncbi:hypothetical protein BUALT_Bualt10G0089700 [Buddleja alternifolia]|uniref:RING-type E3 ubiquitin transferase n=1 Tax=Buddleja alternifolia TaxID=168488 RepID=A0AAV6X4F7_9LAMI|nr:hypothetical protein BUALT_Bualt10G0089700 [Buddleja alternifolia]